MKVVAGNNSAKSTSCRLYPIVAGFELPRGLLIRVPCLQQLQLFGTETAVIWKGIAAGLSDLSIAEAISKQTGTKIQCLLEDISRLKQGWFQQGLLTTSPPQYYIVYGNLKIALQFNTDCELHLVLPAILPGLHEAVSCNWDHLIEVLLKDNFYCIKVDGVVKHELLYQDAAISQILTELEQMRTYRDTTPNLINGSLLTYQENVFAITLASNKNNAVLALSMLSSGASVHAIEQMQLDEAGQVLPIATPVCVSQTDLLMYPFLKNLFSMSCSLFEDNQVVHYLPLSAYHDERKPPKVVDGFLVVHINDNHTQHIRKLPMKEALEYLLSYQKVPMQYISQSQVQALLDWLSNTNCFAISLSEPGQLSAVLDEYGLCAEQAGFYG